MSFHRDDAPTKAEQALTEMQRAYEAGIIAIADRWNIDVELARSLVFMGTEAMDRFEEKGSSRIERIRFKDLIIEEVQAGDKLGHVTLYRVGIKRQEPTAADPLGQRFQWNYVCKSPEEVQAFMRGLMIGEMGDRV